MASEEIDVFRDDLAESTLWAQAESSTCNHDLNRPQGAAATAQHPGDHKMRPKKEIMDVVDFARYLNVVVMACITGTVNASVQLAKH
jgi:hypothetical protein